METNDEKNDKKEMKAFKSYYVVWKPNIAPAPAIIIFLFKSYYVVWKLSSRFLAALASDSLNRTM